MTHLANHIVMTTYNHLYSESSILTTTCRKENSRVLSPSAFRSGLAEAGITLSKEDYGELLKLTSNDTKVFEGRCVHESDFLVRFFDFSSLFFIHANEHGNIDCR